MPNHWIIAPFQSDRPDFARVWQFDLTNSIISIGWAKLGDVSKLNRREILEVIASTYPERGRSAWGLIRNMFWAFYREIGAGDHQRESRRSGGQRAKEAGHRMSFSGWRTR